MTTQAVPSFCLAGRDFALVIEADAAGMPVWRHVGARVMGAALPWRLADAMPPASFSLDARPALSPVPTFGTGWFGSPALLAHRDGGDFAQGFDACHFEWVDKPGHLRLTLTDSVAQIRLEQDVRLDPACDVAKLSARLINTGDSSLDVQWLASGTIPLPSTGDSEAMRVRYPIGRHNHEWAMQDEPLGKGIWSRENRRGLTSHDAFPGAIVMMPGGTAQSGPCFSAQLAWSGNHAQSIGWCDEGFHVWQSGMLLAPGEGRLAPGETLETPEWWLTFSREGSDGAAQNFHGAVRGAMRWPQGGMKPRPVHINSWEGFYFDHDEARLKRLADDAARLGVERFVLDDGWFHRRNDDRAGLGDWWPDAAKYPAGLGPLADHVRGLGMEFGLWVEPEMVNPDSDLYRAHPDWALQISGRAPITARNQLVLDLANPQVSDYLFERLDALLRDLPIAYLKWDHNRDLAHAAGPDGRARYRRQVAAVYRLLDRLIDAHPHVEIEACAGGGGRIDAGIVQRSHRFWTSDCIDATARIAMQRGFLGFMPPEIMGAHVGASPAHATGRAHDMAWRCAVALPGHFGVEMNPATLSADERTVLADWIAFYKAQRSRLHAGRVWCGDAGDGLAWQAHGDDDDLLLIVYRLSPTCQRMPPPVRLPMLDKDAQYDVQLIRETGSPGYGQPDAPAFAAMRATPLAVAGDYLAQIGLAIPMMHAESAAIYAIRRRAA